MVDVDDGAVIRDGEIVVDSFTESMGQNWESWPASGDLSQRTTWLALNNVYVHDFNEDVPTYHPAVLSIANTPTGDFSFMARQRITQAASGPGDIGVLGFILGGQDAQNYYMIQYAERRSEDLPARYPYDELYACRANKHARPILGQWYDMRVNVVGTTFKV